jgi:uncharacterized protein YqeY
MTLANQINADLTGAMRARDAVRLATLRMLKTALVNKAIEKGRDLDEAESLQVVSTLIKQRRESIEQFARGGRQDLVDRETAEIGVLEGYLPAPLDRAELEGLIDEAIAETGASSAKDMGKVMKAVMPKTAGRNVDGKLVNELVRARLH